MFVPVAVAAGTFRIGTHGSLARVTPVGHILSWIGKKKGSVMNYRLLGCRYGASIAGLCRETLDLGGEDEATQREALRCHGFSQAVIDEWLQHDTRWAVRLIRQPETLASVLADDGDVIAVQASGATVAELRETVLGLVVRDLCATPAAAYAAYVIEALEAQDYASANDFASVAASLDSRFGHFERLIHSLIGDE